ncbi:MAG: ASPIC/UnbV domain-containing protein [Myxococcaceae bacterium]|nr:ASPIC/UnbV domain-containing protein [Myxococcaceae bacterium]
MAPGGVPALTPSQYALIDYMIALVPGELPSSFSGWEPKRLWRPIGDGGYEEVAYAEGFDSRLDGRSLVPADFDGDGDLELLMLSRGGRLQLFENVGVNGRAVELELHGKTGPLDAEGVIVRADGLGAFTTTLARGYATTVPPTLHLGLGEKSDVSVEVQWRDGARETFGPLTAGARHVLQQGEGPKARAARAFAAPRAEVRPPWPASLKALGLELAKTPTVVQLFTRGCKPCADEAPVLAKLEGVRVVALGLIADDDTPQAAAASLGITTEAKRLSAGTAEALSRGGELPLPLLLVYGADGALKRVLPGPAQLGDALK